MVISVVIAYNAVAHATQAAIEQVHGQIYTAQRAVALCKYRQNKITVWHNLSVIVLYNPQNNPCFYKAYHGNTD